MKNYRILITSDMHYTDLGTWYGISNEERLQHWVNEILAEHTRQPFDLILINGDISLDYHEEKTPYDKGYSTSYVFMKMYVSKLPKGVPVLVTAGNHEQFPEEAWKKITGNFRQCYATVGNNTFIMLDSFRKALSPVYDSTDEYSQMDITYIQSLLEKYPENNVWLISHWIEMKEESEEFQKLVTEENRIKGLFVGHSHDHRLISLGTKYNNKVIAQTGNFSYTMSGASTGGFWGFRDLVIYDKKAVSSYIMVDSDVILDEGAVHFNRLVNEIVEYQLG